jgi:hypothetical protein
MSMSTCCRAMPAMVPLELVWPRKEPPLAELQALAARIRL